MDDTATRIADYDQWLAGQREILAALASGYRRMRGAGLSDPEATSALLLGMTCDFPEHMVRLLMAAAVKMHADGGGRAARREHGPGTNGDREGYSRG